MLLRKKKKTFSSNYLKHQRTSNLNEKNQTKTNNHKGNFLKISKILKTAIIHQN